MIQLLYLHATLQRHGNPAMIRISNHPYIFFTLLCAIVYAPFSNKPFHIDSPVTVHVARQLLVDPIDPPIGDYGKLLAPWNHTGLPESSVFFITPHPPLIPLYLTPFIAIFGENELALNWAMFPFYAAAALLFFALCGLLAPRRRYEATLLFMVSPVVFVNAQNVMLDLPLADFCMAAFYFAFRSRKTSDALMAGLFAALACLTKFTGGAVVAAALIFYCYEKRWKHAAVFLFPMAVLYGAWMVHNIVTWGAVQLFANGHAHYRFGDIRYRFERLISYLGGTIVFPPILLAVALIVKKYRTATITAFTAAAIWSVLLMTHLHYSPGSAIFYALCAAAGIVLLLIMAAGERSSPWIALSLYTLFHVAGGLFLTLYCTRYLLPFAFIAVLAWIKLMEAGPLAKRWVWSVTIAVSVLLSIALSVADYQYVDAEKRIAANLREEFGNRTVFFQGRLGYLYYMHKAGFCSFPSTGTGIKSGNLLVRNCDSHDDAALFIDTTAIIAKDEFRYPIFPLRTLTGRAGFYGNDRLPYAWVSDPKSRVFLVYERK
jgi:hypothetical protein